MTEYEQARKDIGELLSNKLVEEIRLSTDWDKVTSFVLKSGKTITYYGEVATKIAIYTFKVLYKRDNLPDKLRRCPECNTRASIHLNEQVECNTCDYKTDLTTWNNENSHLKFKE